MASRFTTKQRKWKNNNNRIEPTFKQIQGINPESNTKP